MAPDKPKVDTTDGSVLARPHVERRGLLEKVPHATAAISGTTIAVSVIYNWAYFRVLNSRAFELMTLSDHVSSALVWLPVATGTFFISFFAGIISGAVSSRLRAQTKGEIDSKTQELRPHRKNLWRRAFKISLIGLAIAALTQIGVPKPNPLWSSGAIFVTAMCVAAATTVLDDSELRIRIGSGLPIALMAVSLLATAAILYGVGDASADLRRTDGESRITLVDHSSVMNAIILRDMERGILYRTMHDHGIFFVPWRDIASIQAPVETPAGASPLCRWFPTFCASGH